ncbi:MAG: hypothetical protein WCC60_20740 [Ilumatobacteraceae bacterium]
MRVVRSIVLLVGLGWVSVSCTPLSPSKERASDVYAAVIRWFAAQHDPAVALKVFVEPRGEGSSINVDVQAEVVTAVEDVAVVRFIDTRDEALEDDSSGLLVVRDEGVLIAFGPVQNDAAAVTLEVDQYLSETMLRTFRFDFSHQSDGWVIKGRTSFDEAVTPDEG